MKTKPNNSLRAAWAGTVGFCLLSGMLAVSAAEPALSIQGDPAGLKISWSAGDGGEFILQGSDDLKTWTPVQQSVIKEGDLLTVLVPSDQAMAYYRLVNDGVHTQAAYVGPETCKLCHPGNYDEWIDTGHPFKLNQVVDGQPPAYFSDHQVHVPDTPEGWTWNDVSWVIGGALWKARFVDNDGYIVTGDAVQYNLQTEGWVAYDPDKPVGTKPYNCGVCHTTGWVAVGEGGVHQDGLPGMLGSFADPGITCEACHGPGSLHVAGGGDKSKIVVDTSAAMCGSCHYRGDLDTIPASSGFIKHHEQYNEMLSAGHKNHECVTCHDPHLSSKRGQHGAITKDCTDCHDPEEYADPENFHTQITECTTCHMPRASKSAVAVNQYTGDIHTHIFKINTAADGQMFNEDGSLALGGSGVTLDFVCYQCHKDPDGIGGDGSTKTLEELSAKAIGFHDQE